jgi:tRNA nucleotidyltransferase/poly(A) polymerase
VEDLEKRDFTINAMAWSWASEYLINDEKGLRDLERRVVRMISSMAFDADPVRLLRAYRIAAELGFTIGARTRKAIARQAAAISRVAGERIRIELLRWLRTQRVHQSQRKMMSDKLLGVMFPHIPPKVPRNYPTSSRTSDMPQAIEATGRLEVFLAGDWSLLPAVDDFYSDFPEPDQIVYLKIALLYSGLDVDTAKKNMERMRFSHREKDTISGYLRGHHHLLDLYRKAGQGRLSNEHMAEFFIAYQAKIPYLLLRFLADVDGASGQPGAHCGNVDPRHFCYKMWRAYCGSFGHRLNQPPLVSGRDLMEYLNLPASPAIGMLLKKLRTAQISGRVATREAALQEAEHHLKRRYSAMGSRP